LNKEQAEKVKGNRLEVRFDFQPIAFYFFFLSFYKQLHCPATIIAGAPVPPAWQGVVSRRQFEQ